MRYLLLSCVILLQSFHGFSQGERLAPVSVIDIYDDGGSFVNPEKEAKILGKTTVLSGAQRGMSIGKELSPKSLGLLSVEKPGMNQPKFLSRKHYWLMGVPLGTSIISSLFFNNRALVNYQRYISITDASMEQYELYLHRSLTYRRLSNAFAYSALAIFIADLTFIGIRALKYKSSPSAKREKRDIHLSIRQNQVNGAAMLSLNIVF